MLIGSGLLFDLKNLIDLAHVRFVPDDGAVEFHPGMGFEWCRLRSNDQLSIPSMTPEKKDSGCRALETENPPGIEGASEFHCPAQNVETQSRSGSFLAC